MSKTRKLSVRRLHAEGQGVWQLEAFDAPAVLALALVARIGWDRRAAKMLGALEHSMRQLLLAKRELLCLTCDQQFSAAALPVLWLVLTPYCDNPSEAIVHALCGACNGHPSREDRIIEKLRNSLISDLKIMPPPHREPGHA